MKTTKAVKCTYCGKYPLICSISRFKNNKDVIKEFSKYMKLGYEVIEVTTQDAKNNFGYCDHYKEFLTFE